MKSDLLKHLAMNARTRLMNGGKVKNTKVCSPNVKFRIISNEDSEFIERANSLNEEDILTPLNKLIDKEKFSKLDLHNREKYLFETIEKYARYRNKICGNVEERVLV